MKISHISIILFSIITIIACTKDDKKADHDYKIEITSPNTDNKHVDHTIDIKVNFESEKKETIHHVKVQIINKKDNKVIYDKPSSPHVHATSGKYVYEDSFKLSEANGVKGHTDWILRASVWGHDKDEHKVTKEVEFHVHPKG